MQFFQRRVDQTRCCIASSLPDDSYQLSKDGPSVHLHYDEDEHILIHAPIYKA